MGILRVQAQRLAFFRHRTIPVALVYEHAAEVEVRRLRFAFKRSASCHSAMAPTKSPLPPSA